MVEQKKETLYDILNGFEEVFQELEENGGELTDEIISKLDSLEADYKKKIENIALYIQNLKCDQDVIKQEIDRLNNRLTSIQKKIDGLQNYLLYAFEKQNINKLKTPLITVWKQKSKGKIEWDSIECVPEKYRFATLKDHISQFTPEQLQKADIFVDKIGLTKDLK